MSIIVEPEPLKLFEGRVVLECGDGAFTLEGSVYVRALDMDDAWDVLREFLPRTAQERWSVMGFPREVKT
jgi:hypothetical protein